MRTILAVNEEQQSLTFAGNVPEGYLAQLMRGNFDRVIEGASDAAEMAVASFPDQAAECVIAISCVGRRLMLGGRAEEEVEALVESLAGNPQVLGFYSYGEFSPTSKDGPVNS